MVTWGTVLSYHCLTSFQSTWLLSRKRPFQECLWWWTFGHTLIKVICTHVCVCVCVCVGGGVVGHLIFGSRGWGWGNCMGRKCGIWLRFCSQKDGLRISIVLNSDVILFLVSKNIGSVTLTIPLAWLFGIFFCMVPIYFEQLITSPDVNRTRDWLRWPHFENYFKLQQKSNLLTTYHQNLN